MATSVFIIILLLAGLVVTFFAKPENKFLYHKYTLAIFGLSYLVFWPFISFYYEYINNNPAIKLVAFIVVTIVTVGFLLNPWALSSRVRVVYGAVFIFFVSLLIAITFEQQIKNKISVLSGFFKNPPPSLSISRTVNYSKDFDKKTGGFSFRFPKYWKIKQKRPGLKYLEYKKNDKIVSEVRPHCFHDTPLSFPEIIGNMTEIEQVDGAITDRQCYISEQNLYVCLLKTKGKLRGGIKEKWRWLATDSRFKQNIEIDFIFYTSDQKARTSAMMVLDTLKFTALTEPLPQCITTIDWF